jgi:DNA-binding MarR family transcriptional regulator
VPERPLPPGIGASRRARLANRLNSAFIHVLRRIARDEASEGMTPVRLSALSVLVYGGAQTIGELARREGVSLPTMSRIVDALVAGALVNRVTDLRDRRAVRLEPTRRGRQVMERARARRIAKLAEQLDALNDGELAVLEHAVAVLESLESKAPTAPERLRGRRPREER